MKIIVIIIISNLLQGFLLIPNSQAELSPESPGAIEGTFEVSPQGAATYVIPIKCSPGTAGMKPQLALAYNSQSGPGVMGPGWAITGYSIITRGPMNLARDGIVKGAQFDASDALFLDGDRLIPFARDEEGGFIEYRMEIDNYSRIRGYGLDRLGHDRFTVWTKAGLILEFGNTPDARPLRQEDGAPLLWMCNQILDTPGNYIDFKYNLHQGGDYNLARVVYTGNDKAGLTPYASIEFDYEPLADVLTTKGRGLPIPVAFVAGERIYKNYRLKSIRSLYGERLLAKLTLGYSPLNADPNAPEVPTDSSCGFRLLHITECASDGKYHRPTRFEYTDSTGNNRAWIKVDKLKPPIDFTNLQDTSSLRLGVRYSDLDADGSDDLIYSSLVGGRLERKTFLSKGGQWELTEAFVLPVPLSVDGVSNSAIIVRDINGDSRADVLFSAEGEAPLTLMNSNEGWKNVEGLAAPISLGAVGSPNVHYLLLDFDGDSKLDIIWNQEMTGHTGARTQRIYEWEDAGDEFIPPFPIATDSSFAISIDANADDREDLIYFNDETVPTIYLSTPNGWELQEKGSGFTIDISCPQNREGVRAVDLTGDGKKDLLGSYYDDSELLSFAFSPRKDGWENLGEEYHSPLPLIGRDGIARGVKFEDVNGDGKADFLVHTRFVGTGEVVRQARLMTIEGWANKEAFEFVPPHPLRVVESHSVIPLELPVFFANVDGVLGVDLVYQAPVYGKHAFIPEKETWLSNRQGWQLSVDYSPPALIAQHGKSDLGARFVDVNADGLADLILTSKEKNGKLEKFAKLNKGAGWIDDDKWKLPYPTKEHTGNDTGIRFVDVNGDARVDAVIRRLKKDGTPSATHTFINDPKIGWRDDPTWHSPIPLTRDSRGDLGVRFIDLNGDGLTDIISSFSDLHGNVTSRAWLNSGEGWTENPAYAELPDGCAFSQAMRPVDSSKSHFDVYAGDYDEWKKHVIHRPTGMIQSDLNGDRLPDISFSHQFLEGKGIPLGPNGQPLPASSWYALSLISVKKADDLPTEGRLLTVIALVDDSLHIKIFNEDSQAPIDKSEKELRAGQELINLKRLMENLPLLSGDIFEESKKRQIIEKAALLSDHTLTFPWDEKTDCASWHF